jgi:hypothetical protein
MYTEDLGGYDRGDWEAIEHVDECFPCLDVTSSLALVIKAIHCRPLAKTKAKETPGGASQTSCDICAFMVAPQQEKILRIFNLVAEQK